MRRLLKQRYSASLHEATGHTYRVYLSLDTVDALQAIYETHPSYGDNLRVQDMASIYLERAAYVEFYHHVGYPSWEDHNWEDHNGE
jgi:hypothetical protein